LSQDIFTYIIYRISNGSKTAGNYAYAAPMARRKAILPPVYEQLAGLIQDF
jgi:hypothetical protein